MEPSSTPSGIPTVSSSPSLSPYPTNSQSPSVHPSSLPSLEPSLTPTVSSPPTEDPQNGLFSTLSSISYALPEIRIVTTNAIQETDAFLLRQTIQTFLSEAIRNNTEGWILDNLLMTHSLSTNNDRLLTHRRDGMVLRNTLQDTGSVVVLQGRAWFFDENAPASTESFWQFVRNRMATGDWQDPQEETSIVSVTVQESQAARSTTPNSEQSTRKTLYTVLGSALGASVFVMLLVSLLFCRQRRYGTRFLAKVRSFVHGRTEPSKKERSLENVKSDQTVPDVVTLGISTRSMSQHSGSFEDDDEEEVYRREDGQYHRYNHSANYGQDVSYMMDGSTLTASHELPSLLEERQSQIDEEATTASRATTAHPEYLEEHMVDTASMLDHHGGATHMDHGDPFMMANTSDFLVDVGSVMDHSFDFGGFNSSNPDESQGPEDPRHLSREEEDEGVEVDLPSVSSPSCATSDALNITEDDSVGISATELVAEKWLRSNRRSSNKLLGEEDESDSDNSLEYSTDPQQVEQSRPRKRMARRNNNNNKEGPVSSLLGPPTTRYERNPQREHIDRYFQSSNPPMDNTTNTPDLTAMSADDELLLYCADAETPAKLLSGTYKDQTVSQAEDEDDQSTMTRDHASPTLTISPFPNLITPPSAAAQELVEGMLSPPSSTGGPSLLNDTTLSMSMDQIASTTRPVKSPTQPTSVLLAAMAGASKRPRKANHSAGATSTERVWPMTTSEREPPTVIGSTNVPLTTSMMSDEEPPPPVITPPSSPSKDDTPSNKLHYAEVGASQSENESDTSDFPLTKESTQPPGRTLPLLARMQEAKNNKNKPSYRLWI